MDGGQTTAPRGGASGENDVGDEAGRIEAFCGEEVKEFLCFQRIAAKSIFEKTESAGRNFSLTDFTERSFFFANHSRFDFYLRLRSVLVRICNDPGLSAVFCARIRSFFNPQP